MKTAFRRFLIVVFVVFCSTRLTVYWDDHPDNVPAPLRWIAVQLIQSLMPLTAERLADIEFSFAAAFSLAIVSGTTWLVSRVAKRITA